MSDGLTISREATAIALATETIAIIDKTMENHGGSQMMAVSDMVNAVLDIRSLMTRLLKEMPKLQQEDAVE
jgi:hypothetical protein